MYNIFISYSHKNDLRAEQLQSALKDRGHEVWIDHETMLNEASWSKKIGDALAQCSFVIAIVEELYNTLIQAVDRLETRASLWDINNDTVSNAKRLPVNWVNLIEYPNLLKAFCISTWPQSGRTRSQETWTDNLARLINSITLALARITLLNPLKYCYEYDENTFLNTYWRHLLDVLTIKIMIPILKLYIRAKNNSNMNEFLLYWNRVFETFTKVRLLNVNTLQAEKLSVVSRSLPTNNVTVKWIVLKDAGDY